jgi:hypothetical protein
LHSEQVNSSILVTGASTELRNEIYQLTRLRLAIGQPRRCRTQASELRLISTLGAVMAGLVTAIHAKELRESCRKNQEIEQIRCRWGCCPAWMPGTRPGMTAVLT